MLKLYNTLTKSKQEFKTLTQGNVLMYHCGPTVYWTQHIGNLRAMVMADFIVRTLEYLDYEVNLVRNYTDVGHLTSDEDDGVDKMAKAAGREKLTPVQIAEKYTKIFEQDVADLNIRQPNVKPVATGHIKEMQGMIQTLLDKKFAYQTKLAIYFDVSKAKNYTKLSGQNLEKNISDAGSGEVSDPAKKNPADFALWFFKTGKHANALQTWDSPWSDPTDKADGQGFPGWHIECSAMSKKYLGDTLDIHMGGIEHIPVHHTNEIAQSENANGKKFVNYWLHNEHLTVAGGKMSKSEGTTFSLAEIKDKGYSPLALRFFFLSAHYRSKQNFSWEALDAAAKTLKKLQDHILEFKKISAGVCEDISKVENEYKFNFTAALEDDFNTPQALAVLWEVVKDDKMLNEEKLHLLFDFDRVFGLNLKNIKPTEAEIPKEIEALADNREKFRELEDFEQADEIRQEIELKGYRIEDSPLGRKIFKITN
ncbi:MAG: cysteine--tRNA ligase [bacterium]|nr:cysteine--tRNA ligase [bacterium]